MQGQGRGFLGGFFSGLPARTADIIKRDKYLHQPPGIVLLKREDFASVATKDIPLDEYTDFRSFELVIHRMRPATDAAIPYLRVSTDSGATFLSAGYDFSGTGWQVAGALADDSVGDSEFSLIYPSVTGVGNATAEGLSATIRVYNPGVTTFHAIVQWENHWLQADDSFATIRGAGKIDAAGDITDLRLLFNSGNIAAAGSYSLLGIR